MSLPVVQWLQTGMALKGVFMSWTYRDAHASRSPERSVPVLFVKTHQTLISTAICGSYLSSCPRGAPQESHLAESRQFQVFYLFFPQSRKVG